MDFLEIKKYPEKVLREKCEPIPRMNSNYRKFSRRMFETMDYYKGIGLAAPQVGVNQMLIVARIGNDSLMLANPRIIEAHGSEVEEEGCLSVPDMMVDVNRAGEIIVSGINEKGKMTEIKAKGLWARVLQHEIDHLNGTLIINYLRFFPRLGFELRRRLS